MRLIRTGDLDPATNLALDEALLRSGEETLRLYGWEPAGLSIGFFQRAGEFAGIEGFRLVRRPTGGGAIAHTGELTICWVGRRRRVDHVYEQVNALVTRALASLGVDVGPGEAQPEAAPRGFCFDAHTRYDLLASGRKVFGSAQRRGGGRFLVHGTLVLEQNPLSKGAVSLSELLGRRVTRHDAEHAIIRASAWKLRAEAPTATEWEHANRLVSERYGNTNWTFRR